VTTKRKRSKPFDPAIYLEDDEAIAAYVSEALLLVRSRLADDCATAATAIESSIRRQRCF
jgi:DNA-binding phage protein